MAGLAVEYAKYDQLIPFSQGSAILRSLEDLKHKMSLNEERRNKRFEDMEHRLNGMDHRVSIKFNNIDIKLNDFDTQLNNLDINLDYMEG